jgi:hypothetical protein
MPTEATTQPYDRDAIFDQNGPINPIFMDEAIRALLRALPIDPEEPEDWTNRRMVTALTGLSAMHPRDEIEVMLGVQSLCAYHAAAACWHLGMNHQHPRGSGLRHFSAAASAARTFDTLLKALERRQAKPLAVPPGRPPAQIWHTKDPAEMLHALENRCRGEATDPTPVPAITWTNQACASTAELIDRERIEAENEGLDIANTEGILPGGGMIMPEDPTPQQEAYLARRLVLSLKRERAENERNGIYTMPKLRPSRPGDLFE